MTEELKIELTEMVIQEVKFGFASAKEIFDNIIDSFSTEEVDKKWLKDFISIKSADHKEASKSWPSPTHFENLANCFDELTQDGIICLHNAGYTKQDAEGDCMMAIEQVNDLGISSKGYCYYHSQDLARAVDPGIRNLMLGYDSVSGDEKASRTIANTIKNKLQQWKFTFEWSGSVDQRLEITTIEWLKVPDDQEWGIQRPVLLLSNAKKPAKKPFWKFW